MNKYMFMSMYIYIVYYVNSYCKQKWFHSAQNTFETQDS